MIKRTVTLNNVEPAPLSLRTALGVDLDLSLTFKAQNQTPVDPTSLLPQLVLMPRSVLRAYAYEVATDNAAEGTATVTVPGTMLLDPAGYNLELYQRRAPVNPSDPLVPVGLIAKGVLRLEGSALSLGSLGDSFLQPDFDLFADALLGDDGNDGQSPAKAKRTLAGVMAVASDGLRIGLARGSTFPETLSVAFDGISVGVYGTGSKPLVSAGDGVGVVAYDVSNITLDGFEVVGSGKTVNSGHGVDFAVTTLHRQANIAIRNLSVHGFGKNGINVEGRSGAFGFDTVEVSGCEVYDCTENYTGGAGSAGIYVWSATGYGLAVNSPTHTNVTVSANNVHDCNGKAGATNWAGSGIVIAETQTGLMEGNTVSQCGANSNHTTGPVGQWCYDAISIVIRQGIVDTMRVNPASHDGGGFDIDGGCQYCVIEHCRSENCDGPGLMIYAYADPFAFLLPSIGNTIRDSFSENDGKVSLNQAAALISSANADPASLTATTFTGNSIIVSGAGVIGLQIDGTDDTIELVRQATGNVSENTINAFTGAVLISVARSGLVYTDNVYTSSPPGTAVLRFEGVDFTSTAAFLAAMATVDARWNPADKTASAFLQNYERRAVSAGSNQWARSLNSRPGGKSFASFHVIGTGGVIFNPSIGIANAGAIGGYVGANANAFAMFPNGTGALNGGFPSWGVTYAVGDVVDMAYDDINKRVWYRVNGGNWNNNVTFNPTTNVGGFDVAAFSNTAVKLIVGLDSGDDIDVNFGLAPFAFAPPSGFSPWNA